MLHHLHSEGKKYKTDGAEKLADRQLTGHLKTRNVILRPELPASLALGNVHVQN